MKLNNTIDDIRLKSTLNFIETSIFTRRCFFYTILGFTQSHLGASNDIDGFIQSIPGSYKSEKPMKNTGIDKVDLKCDGIICSIVNGIRESILYRFALSSPAGHKKTKNLE